MKAKEIIVLEDIDLEKIKRADDHKHGSKIIVETLFYLQIKKGGAMKKALEKITNG